MARILFVDDDHLTLETYNTIMSYFGHESYLADSGMLAIELAERQSPDFIVVDMNMPDMHGFDVLRRLRKNPLTAGIPAMMVSASPETVTEGALAVGAQEYRCKPVRPDELLEIIEKYTAGDA